MNHRASTVPPAAREDGLLVEHVGDELVVYDVDRKEAHALSPTAAAVFTHADGRTSVDDLRAAVSEHTGAPVDLADIWDALVQLEERHLLDVPKGGISRRDLIRRSAVVAASVPLVTSVMLPSGAYAAASCNIGAACTSDNDCPKLDSGNLPSNQRCSTTPPPTVTAPSVGDAKTCRCYEPSNCQDVTVNCQNTQGPIQGQHTWECNTCQFL